MGIVARQSLITSIISYIGVAIGYINLIFLYPKFLELDQIGLMRAIQDSGMLLTPFVSLGLNQCISRYYPKFSISKKSLSELLGLLIMLTGGGLLLTTCALLLFKQNLIDFFAAHAPDLPHHLGLILWLTLTLTFSGLFEQLARSKMLIALPAFLKEVVVRLMQSILVLLYFTSIIDFSQLLIGSVVVYTLVLIFLMYRLELFQGDSIQFKITSISGRQIKEMLIFALVGFVGLSSVTIIAKLDSLMVTGLAGLEAAAIYTTTFYMATVIEIPKRAMTQSAGALLAHAFERNDQTEIREIYYKTALNQFIIGSLLLIGLWANMDNIFNMMPKGDHYREGFLVAIIIGIAKLTDMSFGPSSELIGLSKYYWFNLIVISILAGLSVVSNIMLIPIYGISGAAAGAFIALLIYNFTKYIFIRIKFNLSPFGINTMKVIPVILFSLVINYLLPKLDNLYADIVLRSAVITLTFGGLILLLRCSEEISQLLRRNVEWLSEKLK